MCAVKTAIRNMITLLSIQVVENQSYPRKLYIIVNFQT